MWIIEGAFDSVGIQPETEQPLKKLKLLKSGRCYPLGRKAKHPLQLVINNPKISGEHVSFIVGESPIKSVDDVNFRPKLTIRNHKNKALQVGRKNETNKPQGKHQIQPLADDELYDGDVVALVTGIYIVVHWKPVCCFIPPKSPDISFEKCASLGVKVVSSHLPEVTHHLTPTLSASPSIVVSMLTPAYLVRYEWLTELLHLGTNAPTPESLTALEKDFQLPPFSQYRPTPDSSLPPPLRAASIWEPNNKRAGLLKNKRLVFVEPNGRELDPEMRMLVERCGSEYEIFDINGGVLRWKQLLTRSINKATENKKELGIMGNIEMLQHVSGDSWEEICSILKSFKLKFLPRSQLLDAILYVDSRYVDSSSSSDTENSEDSDPRATKPLPYNVSSGAHKQIDSQPEENPVSSGTTESVLPARKLPRKRVTQTSRLTTPINEGSVANNDASEAANESSVVVAQVVSSPVELSIVSRASAEPEVAGVPGRKKPLVRRARTNATPLILGVDDPSLSSIAPSQISGANDAKEGGSIPPAYADTLPSQIPSPKKLPSSLGRSGKLKRRAQVDASANLILPSLQSGNDVSKSSIDEPPLKRFKALFDETDPDRVASQSTNDVIDSQYPPVLENNTTQDRYQLAVIPEEWNDRSNTGNVPETDNEMEVEANLMEDDPLSHEEKIEDNQREPLSTLNGAPMTSIVSKRTSSKKGAPPGLPDTDDAFLQAVASTRKGRKGEDDFDREFNNLRISKPDLDGDQVRNPADDWKVLADFGDESNIQGNFMVIVEMDVPGRAASRNCSVDPETNRPVWLGKPDFKKFKKKTAIRQKPTVELVTGEINDYGMGETYWKNFQSQPQANADIDFDAPPKQKEPIKQRPEHLTIDTNIPKSRSQSQRSTRVSLQENGTPQRADDQHLQAINEDEQMLEDIYRSPEMAHRRSQEEDSNALFLEDIDEDEDGNGEKNVKGHQGPDVVDLNLDLDEIGDDEEENMDSQEPPTICSSASKSTSSPLVPKGNKKRGASTALLDDEEDSTAFRGFGGRKKMKAR